MARLQAGRKSPVDHHDRLQQSTISGRHHVNQVSLVEQNTSSNQHVDPIDLVENIPILGNFSAGESTWETTRESRILSGEWHAPSTSYGSGPPDSEEGQDQGTNQRASKILRKVNSGFEILPPGTFAFPDHLVEAAEKRRSKRLYKRQATPALAGAA